MSDHQRKSFATPNYSCEASYPTPQEKPIQEQEKSKNEAQGKGRKNEKQGVKAQGRKKEKQGK